MTGRLRMELKTMGSAPDFYKNEFIQDAMRDAQASLVRGQLSAKFGGVPKWVDEKLGAATSAQIERWSKKILIADTLEGVLGKKQSH